MPAPGYETGILRSRSSSEVTKGRSSLSVSCARIRVGSMTNVHLCENHSRLLAYMVDKHASTYQLHLAAVVEDIRQRIASFEAVLEKPPAESDRSGGPEMARGHPRTREPQTRTPSARL